MELLAEPNTNSAKHFLCLGPMIPVITCVIAKVLTNGTVGTVSIIFKKLFKSKKKPKAKDCIVEVKEAKSEIKEPDSSKPSKSSKISTPLTSIWALATRLPLKLAETVTSKKQHCSKRMSCIRQQELNAQNNEAFKKNKHVSFQGTH